MLVRTAAFAFLALVAALNPSFAQGEPYVRPDQADLTKLLAPAPQQDSLITREDVRILLAIQQARTPELIAMANADVDRVLSRFSEAAGTDLSKEKAPLANALVNKAWANANAIVQNAKKHWDRTRPFLAFPDIKLVVPKEDTGSYPSGHATWGMMTAIILADMLPEKARVLYDRGVQFGFERLIGGIHYPSDVEAGRVVGTVVVALMLNDPAFKADFAKATKEVRDSLGLPALGAAVEAKPEPALAK